jgi:hypothetical protein
LSQLGDAPIIRGRFTVAKFWADDDLTRATPYETLEADNMVLTAGWNAIFNRLSNLGSVTAFDATNGRLCVGNSGADVAAGQTDLQGGAKTRKLFDAAPSVSSGIWTAVTTFTTADANHEWLEAGIANASSGGVLLNRSLVSFGLKTSSVQWVLTSTLTGVS